MPPPARLPTLVSSSSGTVNHLLHSVFAFVRELSRLGVLGNSKRYLRSFGQPFPYCCLFYPPKQLLCHPFASFRLPTTTFAGRYWLEFRRFVTRPCVPTVKSSNSFPGRSATSCWLDVDQIADGFELSLQRATCSLIQVPEVGAVVSVNDV